jgi:hypothetical protein
MNLSLSRQYTQWVLVNKQIEQLNKREIFSKNASMYLPVVSKLQELYTRLQKNIEEVLVGLEYAYEERLETWVYWKNISAIKWDIEAAESLLQWAEQAISKEKHIIQKFLQQKDTHNEEIKKIRDSIREITAVQGYNIGDLNTLLKDINVIEEKNTNIDKKVTKSELLIRDNEQGKIALEADLLGLQQQFTVLKSEKKSFDKEYYSKKLLEVFSKRYDSRPRKTVTTYSTTAELFGITPVEREHNLMKDWIRLRSETLISWSKVDTSYQRLPYNKILGVKNALDSLWVVLDENTIHQFSDVLYIYAKSIDKWIIVSNQKFISWEKEVYSHATFILPWAPIFKEEWVEQTISFPTPLYAKRIRFDNEEKRETDLIEYLLKDNNDESFKKVIHTYNEERGSIKFTHEKVNPIGELATEASMIKNIITSHFKDRSAITNQAYLDFANERNKNKENKHQIKATFSWLLNILWGKRPIQTKDYIFALLYDDHESIANIEKEYDDSLLTVYNNNTLKDNIYSLIQAWVLHEGILGSIKYIQHFVDNCVIHIWKEKNIQYDWLSQREKYNLINERYWINGTPSKLSIVLGWLQSRDESYQKLLLQKFIAVCEGKDDNIIRSIQNQIDLLEPGVKSRLWAVDKNIFKRDVAGEKESNTKEAKQESTEIPEHNKDITELEEKMPESALYQDKVLDKSNKEIKEVVIKKEQGKIEPIIISPEELEEIPEVVNKIIDRVVKTIHESPRAKDLEYIKKLFQYWYIYFRKQKSELRKYIEKPHTFFGKFYQKTYLQEISNISTDIPDEFKHKFIDWCNARNRRDSIKNILLYNHITNKRK